MKSPDSPCQCTILRMWAQTPDAPFTERDGRYFLGDGSSDDPRLEIRFCPSCGGIEGFKPGRTRDPCVCGVMAGIVSDFPSLMEFDPQMNEFHILGSDGDSQYMVDHCIACGGGAPQSRRESCFEKPGPAEYEAARAMLAELETVEDFERAFGPATSVIDISDWDAVAADGSEVSVKIRWTFEPSGSKLTFCLQLMKDGRYEKSCLARQRPAGDAPRNPESAVASTVLKPSRGSGCVTQLLMILGLFLLIAAVAGVGGRYALQKIVGAAFYPSTVDIEEYPTALTAWMSWAPIDHFPPEIPSSARDARLSNHPRGLENGGHLQLYLELPADEVATIDAVHAAAATHTFRGGDTNDHSNQPGGVPTTLFHTGGGGKFDSSYNVYVLSAVPGQPQDRDDQFWDHGTSCGVAVSRRHNAVVYWAESW